MAKKAGLTFRSIGKKCAKRIAMQGQSTLRRCVFRFVHFGYTCEVNMSASIRLVRRSVAMLLLSLGCAAWAGPEDQGSKYPVRIGVGGGLFGGIVDSGGTSTLSYEDAIDAGLLDVNGDPVNPPNGSRSIGGAGGNSVVVHRFDNVSIGLTPLAANGTTASGDTRQITATVYVAKKPAEQSGANAAEKAKKTSSLITKVGANVAGATIGGGQFKLTDTATSNPLKNNRSTGWTNAGPAEPTQGPQIQIPLVPRIPLDPDTGRSQIPGVGLNGIFVTADFTSLPTTLIPVGLAALIGLTPIGTYTLDDITLASLFTEGYIDAMPGDALALQYGYIDVTLPGLSGAFEILHVAAMINPFSDDIVLGVNGLVPANWDGWLDNSTGLFNLAAIPEPGSLLLLLAAILAWLATARSKTRRPAAAGGRVGD